jgi:hypothetical protein
MQAIHVISSSISTCKTSTSSFTNSHVIPLTFNLLMQVIHVISSSISTYKTSTSCSTNYPHHLSLIDNRNIGVALPRLHQIFGRVEFSASYSDLEVSTYDVCGHRNLHKTPVCSCCINSSKFTVSLEHLLESI